MTKIYLKKVRETHNCEYEGIDCYFYSHNKPHCVCPEKYSCIGGFCFIQVNKPEVKDEHS